MLEGVKVDPDPSRCDYKAAHKVDRESDYLSLLHEALSSLMLLRNMEHPSGPLGDEYRPIFAFFLLEVGK